MTEIVRRKHIIEFNDNNELLNLVKIYCDLIIEDEHSKNWIKDILEIIEFECVEINYATTISCNDSVGFTSVKNNSNYVEEAFKFILSSSKPFTYPRFENINISITYVDY